MSLLRAEGADGEYISLNWTSDGSVVSFQKTTVPIVQKHADVLRLRLSKNRWLYRGCGCRKTGGCIAVAVVEKHADVLRLSKNMRMYCGCGYSIHR